MPPEAVTTLERPVDILVHSRKPQDDSSNGVSSEDAKTLQSSFGNETSDSAGNESSTPAPKVLYRYIVKDEEGTIVQKDESNQPIEFEKGLQISAPAKEIILEVATTKETETEYGRTTSEIITKLKIHSHHLINALKELISYYPGLNLYSETGIVELPEPYSPLVHYMDALKDYKTNQPKTHDLEMITTTNEHIDILLELLDEHLLDKEIKVERERHLRNPPVCTWEYAWMLLPPGTFVWIHGKNKEPKAAIISLEEQRARFVAWRIAYNSDMHLRVKNQTHNVDYFEGEKEISQLSICPQKWASVDPKIIEEQTNRGKKYAELFKPCYMEYSGQIQGKVMADHSAWLAQKPKIPLRPAYQYRYDPDDELERPYHQFDSDSVGGGCECLLCFEKTEHLQRPPKDVPMKDWPHDPAKPEKLKKPLPKEFYLLCDSIIGGYALNEGKWVSLHLDRITDPKFEDNPFDNLVLDQETKSTIEALVWNYALTDTKVQSWSTDFVKNKGEGRIFLLHGSPGVGKTCTAECVADLIGRPLLSLTCGDMGITASDVEKNFKEFIDLGERWGAVVLMDEADVYLEQRTSENLQRNSLVSVFLRTLEYFRGILFLTTNRVGAFDDAFISRIHVALHYKPLSDEYRKKIWEKNFRRLNNEGNITVDSATIIYAVSDADVIAVKWNGREIRNAFQTAVALAQFEARRAGRDNVVLEVQHLKRVVMMSKQFKDYITSTHKNQDETKRARIMESRNDEFSN